MMMKGRGRDPRTTMPATSAVRFPGIKVPLAKPEPDYEVVDFPSEQYVNAKIEPPPPPPPRPPTGHPIDAGASCGLCGGGGARVRCTECGRRALCASCDDMYHRHPKRRHHQRQALTQAQLREVRPPLPPKGTPPVPPPRRHKMGGDRSNPSPIPSTPDLRRATLNPSLPMAGNIQRATITNTNHFANQRPVPPTQISNLQPSTPKISQHLGSMPYLPDATNQINAHANHEQTNMRQFSTWSQQRGPMAGYNGPMNVIPAAMEPWATHDNTQNWGRPMRRGTSVMELSGNASNCSGCGQCMPNPWRYDSCSNLEHPWAGTAQWSQNCCMPYTHNPRMHSHPHSHLPQTPQPYRRAESRAMSRAASRAGSRAASPALSVRSRASRRTKHRTPSPSLPSSDADSESEAESDKPNIRNVPNKQEDREASLGPAPSPPPGNWQCEHCTFVNEPGLRVCAVCCKTPTITPKIITEDSVRNGIADLKVSEKSSNPINEQTIDRMNNGQNARRSKSSSRRTSANDIVPSTKMISRVSTPPRTVVTKNEYRDRVQFPIRQDIAVGPSPPKEIDNKQGLNLESQTRQNVKNLTTKESNVRLTKNDSRSQKVEKHSVSVGPSPPREITTQKVKSSQNHSKKVSIGTSPSPENIESRPLSRSSRTNVSNTGTSPPPQNISTQTYEMPSDWEKAPASSRARQRRRFRDEAQRERSHSRLSLSSDTRESERSAHTSGSRWDWPRDSSPNGDWSESERRKTRLTRRASHLDVRRGRPSRRSSMYGSEAPSPEMFPNNRAISLEALAATGSRREIERGLELVQLMEEAEKLGFSAAEIHAALAQNPVAPLAWLKERWPSLCAGVRAAAARLAPGANISELEARAALAKHRGAMWPAVTECVERNRRKADMIGVSEEGRLKGHVWGPPIGVDDDSVPPINYASRSRRPRAEDSSDEYAESTNNLEDDVWMYLPFNITSNNDFTHHVKTAPEAIINKNSDETNIAEKLKELLKQAGFPNVNEQLILKNLLSNATTNNEKTKDQTNNTQSQIQSNFVDLGPQENDFIHAYNELANLSTITNLDKNNNEHEVETKEVTNEVPNENITIVNNTIQKKIANTITEHISATNVNPLSYTNNNVLNILSQNEIVEPQLYNNNNNKNISLGEHEINMRNVLSIKEQLHINYREPTQNIDFINKIQENVNQNIEVNPFTNTDQLSLIDKSILNTLSQDEKKDRNNVIVNKDTINESIPQRLENTLENTNMINEHKFTNENLILDQNVTERPNSESKLVSVTPKSFSSGEKSNNLSEIFDNTQKLIQQMKNEINTDINSISDNVESEHQDGYSSDDILASSEQESSYSNTPNETDNVTSDEKEMTSSDEDFSTKKFKINHQSYDRKSSEDNEEFEEAMDHIDNQIDDIKRSNIEMLDSIVQSLREEHTITIASNDSKTTENQFSEKDNITKTIKKKAPMLNQNSFTIVSSFDEIYQEINNESTQQNNSESENPYKEDPIVNKNAYAKNEIYTVIFKPRSPQKVITHEIQYPILKPIINNVIASMTENNNFIENQVNNKNMNKLESAKSETENDYTTLKPETSILNIAQDKKSTDINEEIPINDDNNGPTTVKSTIIDNNPKNIILDKSEFTTLDDNKSKNLIFNKSNIPKLVKTLQKNKEAVVQKVTKVITSKVPVRKTSIKQYAAPAPPKSHFGNINNGSVKDLQTRLFDKKVIETTKLSLNTELKASTTSTMSKKHKAPSPPSVQQNLEHQPSDKIELKKPFFRETCRTEDEWTESDAEDQPQNIKSNSEVEFTPQPSTLASPVTMRQISGQLIDLTKIKVPEGSPERQARMLLAEGATENWEQAQLAVELISKGSNTSDALLAALECMDLQSALVYLHQDCELCASKYPEHEMVSMFRCTHRCCRECARHYFTVQITERSIADCVCPYCKEPELENLPEDDWLDYFAHMDILLKTLLEAELHELFQRKLRDRTLARDPNFRWCVECSSGFFVHPKQKKLRCPECKSISCSQCRKPWNANHNGLSCEEYATWLEDNDPERSIAAVQQHLRENGLECPRCHFKYSLSRGGCMHFTCTQCKYEFCYGCGKPFKMGARCGLSEYCAKLGLHSHHPRNCLFYLRDKEPRELQTLLQMNNVNYEIKEPDGGTSRCPVQLQRETPTGLIDTICGSEVAPKQAGLCKMHYVEYLAGLARSLDPIPIMEVSELVAELRRRALPLPERGPWDTDPIYAGMCAEIVREKIPLD